MTPLRSRKYLTRAAIAIAIAAVLTVAGGRMGLLSGKRPENLGVRDGQLAPCKKSPNCVGSMGDARADPGHYVEPIVYTGPPEAAWAALHDALRGFERAVIIRDEPVYLRAEFASRLLGFVDDAEFLLDGKSGVIHVRSASRLGRRDFGVNRARIEAIRARLSGASPARTSAR